MTPGSKTAVIGLIAMVIGVLLVMGALSFLAVSLFMRELPRLIFIAPVVQILLGLLASAAGFLLRRGHAAAGYVLVVVAICVILNLVFYVSMFVVIASRAT